MTNLQPSNVKNLDIYGNAALERSRAVGLLDRFQKEAGRGAGSVIGTPSSSIQRSRDIDITTPPVALQER